MVKIIYGEHIVEILYCWVESTTMKMRRTRVGFCDDKLLSFLFFFLCIFVFNSSLLLLEARSPRNEVGWRHKEKEKCSKKNSWQCKQVSEIESPNANACDGGEIRKVMVDIVVVVDCGNWSSWCSFHYQSNKILFSLVFTLTQYITTYQTIVA